MMVRICPFAFCISLAVSGAGLAEPIQVTAPKGAVAPPVSIYLTGNAAAGPVVQLGVSETADLPPGEYQFGFDNYAYRSAPFRHSQGAQTDISLGALQINVPNGIESRFSVFSAVDGQLLFPLQTGESNAVPAGEFLLRRDLSEVSLPVRVVASETAILPLGAISVNIQPLPHATPIYVAPLDVDAIAAVLYADNTQIPLPAGDYRLRTLAQEMIAMITVANGETANLPVTHLHWASLFEGASKPVARVDEQGVQLPVKGVSDVIFFSDTPVGLGYGDGKSDRLNADQDGRLTIWQNSDGTLANVTGIPFAFQRDVVPVALAGGTLRLIAELAEPAEVVLFLHQSGEVLAELTLRLRSGWNNIEFFLPDELTPDIPLSIELQASVVGPALIGRLENIAVHQKLEAAPTDLKVAETEPTFITLVWKAPEGSKIAGYRVFRGDGKQAASGAKVINGLSFSDLALSAGRSYHYRICPVDILGLLGPCAEISAETTLR